MHDKCHYFQSVAMSMTDNIHYNHKSLHVLYTAGASTELSLTSDIYFNKSLSSSLLNHHFLKTHENQK